MKTSPIRWLWLIILLAGCTAVTLTPTAPTGPTATVQPTATAIPSPTPTPLPRDLTICLGVEPTSLYLYSDPRGAAEFIRQAIYDGPIDTVNYTYQPVILEKLPSLADGDAVIVPVEVSPGDRVLDTYGNITPLAASVRIRPAGCRSDDCALVYTDGPQLMDQMHVTFTLKAGLRWADETPLTALDSLFSFNLARQTTGAAASWFEDRTAGYLPSGDRTVTWSGSPGFLPVDYARAFWTPLPEHAWRYYTPEDFAVKPDVNRTPWGYGPYLIDEWQPGAFIHARRNPHYYRAEEGLPRFDEITFRFISHYDPAVGLNALEAGYCDLLAADTYPAADWERLKALEAAGKARLHVASGPVWEHLTFKVQAGPNDDRPLFFADVRTRHAVAYCLDRERLIAEVIDGLSPVPDAYAPAEHPYFPADTITRYSFDQVRGQALLEAVGWRDLDGDGVREAHGVAEIADGTRLSLLYRTTNAPLPQAFSARVVDDLARCGMEVTVELLEVPQFYAGGANSPLYGRGFDLAGFAWFGDVEPSCELYSSERIPGAGNLWEGENVGGYVNAEYDALCRQALSTLPGEDAHAAAHREALRLFSEELPALPLFLHPRLSVARPDLGGFQADPFAPETWALEAFEIVP